MAPRRREQVLLGALVVVVLAAVMYRAWTDTSVVPSASSNPQGTPNASATAGRNAQAAAGAPDVHLEALEAQRTHPDRAARNLFRFKPKPQPAPAPERPAVAAPPATPQGPPPVAPPPPITLKCIGVFDRGRGQRIAILTDGIGPPMYASEGQTVAGRYRLLRIGAESIEMAYLDGRGRQTIRISGS